MAEEKKAFDEWVQLFACDDPYWKVPTRYMDRSRVGAAEKKIEKFEKRYPGCIDDLFEGVPTYYCVLCVSRNDSRIAIEKAYERKKECSTYPDEVLERAYEMLSDEKKRSTYDEILRVFFKLLQAFTAIEKRELIEEHDDWLRMEEKHAAMEYILKNRKVWIGPFLHGLPTFYEVLDVDRAGLKDSEEIECKNKNVDNRLAEEICKILNNPQLRFEYDFMLDELDSILGEENIEAVRSEMTFGDGKDAFFLMLLKYHVYLEKYVGIMRHHQDWEEYMDEKTFYSVLSIDAGSIPEDKRAAENFIRTAYRDTERTEEVNLAYSVLKNSRLRTDYDWLLKNGEWVSEMHEFDIEDVDDARIEAVMEIADACIMDAN
jgi:curved DNA-binding protein CbpA